MRRGLMLLAALGACSDRPLALPEAKRAEAGADLASPPDLGQASDLSSAPDLALAPDLGCGAGGCGFAPPVVYLRPDAPIGVVSGDFDEDGRADFITADQGGSISIFLGNGDRSFQLPVNLPAGPEPVHIAAVDLDGDHHLDLVVASTVTPGSMTPSTGDPLQIFLGKGDGSFAAPIGYDLDPSLVGMLVADLDGDGRIDVAGVHYDSKLRWHRGLGNGAFAAQATILLPVTAPTALAGGQIDSAAPLDLVVTDFAYQQMGVLLGQGGGVFTATPDLTLAEQPAAIALGDLDGDGLADAVVVGNQGSEAVVRLGKGGGSFGNPVAYPLTSSTLPSGNYSIPTAVLLIDLDGDGHLDAAIAAPNLPQLSILLGKGDGSFAPPVSYPVGRLPTSIAAADFDGDGHLDLVVVNAESQTLSFLWGRGDGSFDHAGDDLGAGSPIAVAVTDLDADGKLDVLIADFDSPGATARLGNGDGTLRPPIDTPFPGTWAEQMVVGDLDGDSHPDAVIADYNMTWHLLYGNGDGHFTRTAAISEFSGISYLGDLDGDGHVDLAGAVYQGGAVIRFGDGSGGFTARKAFGDAQLAALRFADFDGDGRLDAALLSAHDSGSDGSLGAFTIWLGGAGRSFQSTGESYVAGAFAISGDLADFDHDGRLDLFAVNLQSETVTVFAGTGGGHFGSAQTLACGPQPSWGAAGDFDGDGNSDLVINNRDGHITLLRGDGHGHFAPPQSYATGLPAENFAVGDLDGDGRPDLVLAGSQHNGISVMLNRF